MAGNFSQHAETDRLQSRRKVNAVIKKYRNKILDPRILRKVSFFHFLMSLAMIEENFRILLKTTLYSLNFRMKSHNFVPAKGDNPNIHRKNGFVTATKSGTTDKIFVAATENFAAGTKCFVDRT